MLRNVLLWQRVARRGSHHIGLATSGNYGHGRTFYGTCELRQRELVTWIARGNSRQAIRPAEQDDTVRKRTPGCHLDLRMLE